MAPTTTPDKEGLLVEVINNAEDFEESYHCISEAFGRQAHDAIWIAFNPGWDTSEGKARGIKRIVERWHSTTSDNKGNANTVFLKATLPDPDRPGRRIIVGFAIWVQASAVEGYGDITSGDLSGTMEALYPGNKSEQRFLEQMSRSLVKRRLEYVKSKATASPPAIMALDLCATHPSFQRRGVASELVQWGLDEARRRGIPDLTTEASSMGRHVYQRLGFQPQGPDIVYEVDEEFSSRDKPPNVFMLFSTCGEHGRGRSLQQPNGCLVLYDRMKTNVAPLTTGSAPHQGTTQYGLSIGKLQAALASATNEVTVAAANINFDFALVKCEAPPEYQPLGQALSSFRRAEAEGGSLHITARRLGALFDGLCPNTPNLLRAFGTRAAEISKAATASSQVKMGDNWIFSDYTGIDSTSLWAAATSGKAALPLYLLACLLARAWNDADAISLWVEIVSERRREIATRFQNGEPLSFALAAAAAQQDISRDQLARWDASARAWLKTADAVKLKQRKQFLLIANNISIPVNEEKQPFATVKNGAVLLGISAWHIYPDMIVFSGKAGDKPVVMNDPLVHPGGVISLGLCDSKTRESRGVYWSLSLAHHKFYGRPVQRTAEVNGDGSRLTLRELQMVIIGVILGKWKVPPSETIAALNFLLQCATSLSNISYHTPLRWVEMIKDPVTQILKDGDGAIPLISLGRRRTKFLPSDETGLDSPFFGLDKNGTLLSLVEKPDNRIQLLRRLAARVDSIKCCEAYIVFHERGKWYLATALPVHYKNGSVTRASNSGLSEPELQPMHFRWTGTESVVINPLLPEATLPEDRMPFTRGRKTISLTRPIRTLRFFIGDANLAAIFVDDEAFKTHENPSSIVGCDDITWSLQHNLIRQTKLVEFFDLEKGRLLDTLNTLAFASDFYKSLDAEGATISSQILTQSFKLRHRSGITFGSKNCWTMEPLDIIAYFETGTELLIQQFNPEQILGISSRDSIYVRAMMLNDPSSCSPPSRFCRLLGNIGRPGLTILTSPKEPEVRDLNLGSWRQAIEPFDGTSLDCFGATSLHLTFTEWSMPLYQSSAVGQRDSEAVHAEAVVSVRDAGVWVGDIDIIAALQHPDVLPLPPHNRQCSHTKPSKPPMEIMSLETWDQILNCPDGAIVTRSSKNWVARLAISAVLAQHCRLESKRIYICPEDTCWSCVDPSPKENIIYVY
ncbi:hypothetical protein F5Y19DRAFT_462881 [Xylariaceae sp. FL1651]|nr:hypothetical protein F5Y19DRAFT_462881 [Xylariaceae sp. FL1651]